MTRITVDDLRRANYCVRGLRRWFVTHDMDFADFIENGVSVDEIPESVDPGIIENVLRVKLRRTNDNREGSENADQ